MSRTSTAAVSPPSSVGLGSSGQDSQLLRFRLKNRLMTSSGREWSSFTARSRRSVGDLCAYLRSEIQASSATAGEQMGVNLLRFPLPGEPGEEIRQDDPAEMSRPIGDVFSPEEENLIGWSPNPWAGSGSHGDR